MIKTSITIQHKNGTDIKIVISEFQKGKKNIGRKLARQKCLKTNIIDPFSL